MIDLEYLTEELEADGFEVVVFIDANKPIDHRVRVQNHDHKYKSDNGFNIDGLIDGSIATYIKNCGLSNIMAERHAKSGAEIPSTAWFYLLQTLRYSYNLLAYLTFMLYFELITVHYLSTSTWKDFLDQQQKHYQRKDSGNCN
jgi:hypothetical protein